MIEINIIFLLTKLSKGKISYSANIYQILQQTIKEKLKLKAKTFVIK